MIDFGGVRTYLHGASSNLHRNVMAPYLLHWYLIEDAIVRGMHTFDFWGIAPSGASEKHPWQGITRYKMGFNGQVIEHPGTVDLQVEHFWYGFYRCIRGIRRMKV
jgi:lipid II:glycine glycyltransferase (peptidoglycan interpeptide bridge formation enzyme)